MPETQPPWHSNIHVLLLHTAQPSVLMLPTEHGWVLLHLQRPGRMWLPQVQPIPPLLAQHLGLQATVLRCVQVQEEEQHLHAVFLMENHSPRWQPPPDWQWVGRERLRDLPLARPEHREIIDTCLAESASRALPARRAPWACQGWMASAQEWIAAQLERLDVVLVPPLEQVRHWGISSVLRVRTFRGHLYFKVSSTQPLFAREAVLVQALARRYPDCIPAPLAIDPERNWMLLADGGRDLRSTPDSTLWTDALTAFARLQRTTTEQVQDWLSLGCQDRRLEVLAAQIDPLLQAPQVAAQLPVDDLAQLHRLAPQLKELCGRLSDYRIPDTLGHGDLHPGNIAGQPGQYVFFDWTDACVTHPWFDLLPMLLDTSKLPDAANACPRMCEQYLALWTDYAPMERLLQAWQLARPLAALYQAVSYQHIIAGLETAVQRELAWGVPFWLRQVLATLPAGGV